MAIGKASDFQIYHDEFHAGMFESIDTNTALFNEASANCIRLVPQEHIGDYQKEAFLKEISTLVSRRDTTSTSAATSLAMTEGQEARVKINRKVGPVEQTLDAFRKIGMSQSEMSLRFGAMVGERVVKDMILTAIKGAAAGIRNQASALNSATGATITYAGLVGAIAKFGDANDKVKCWVFHSKNWFDLVAAQVGISTALEGVGETAVQSGSVPGLGRRVLVIDSSDLIVSGSPDHYLALGLVENGVVVLQSEDALMVEEIVTGLENLTVRFQGEHAFSLGLKGYTWDITNGGAGPADAANATGSNWDLVATSIKNSAGVCLRTQ